MFHQWAPGATFWLAKGTTLYNTLADYMRGVLFPAGYVEVKAPIVFNKALWETSGHWQHYRENMFLVEGDEGEQMGLKAMNCPGHMLIFASEVRSYRDLPHPPPRADAAAPQRGVRRAVRPDARAAVQPGRRALLRHGVADRRGSRALLRLVQRVYGDFGLTTGDEAVDAAAGVPRRRSRRWDHAEAELKRALDAVGEAYTVNEGDGAFYGPKIDFDVTDAIGRKWQCATIQLDYQLPRAVRPEVHRGRQRRAPAGGHPPGDFRQFRAVPGPAHRALRRRLAAVAGAGPGGGAADCRPPPRLRRARCGTSWPPPGSGSNSTSASGEDWL